MTVTCCKNHLKEGLALEGEYVQTNLKWYFDNHQNFKKVAVTINPNSVGKCQFCEEPSDFTLWNDIYMA